MSAFDDLMATSDAAIFSQFGDPFRVTRKQDDARLEPVTMIIDRGVPVELGESPSLGTVVEYRISEAGRLSEGDRIDLLAEIHGEYSLAGEAYELNRAIEDDGVTVKRIAVPVGC